MLVRSWMDSSIAFYLLASHLFHFDHEISFWKRRSYQTMCLTMGGYLFYIIWKKKQTPTPLVYVQHIISLLISSSNYLLCVLLLDVIFLQSEGKVTDCIMKINKKWKASRIIYHFTGTQYTVTLNYLFMLSILLSLLSWLIIIALILTVRTVFWVVAVILKYLPTQGSESGWICKNMPCESSTQTVHFPV